MRIFHTNVFQTNCIFNSFYFYYSISHICGEKRTNPLHFMHSIPLFFRSDQICKVLSFGVLKLRNEFRRSTGYSQTGSDFPFLNSKFSQTRRVELKLFTLEEKSERLTGCIYATHLVQKQNEKHACHMPITTWF